MSAGIKGCRRLNIAWLRPRRIEVCDGADVDERRNAIVFLSSLNECQHEACMQAFYWRGTCPGGVRGLLLSAHDAHMQQNRYHTLQGEQPGARMKNTM